MKTYTIKEIKEQGIWVKTDGNEQHKKLKSTLGFAGEVNNSGILYYKYTKNSPFSYGCEGKIQESFIEFSQIDFDEFVLPAKWVIDRELNKNIIGKWFNENNTVNSDNVNYITDNLLGKYYHFPKRETALNCHTGSKIDDNYTEITFEQFLKYILKENVMEKEIIGYKCPINLFGTSVKAGTIWVKINTLCTYYILQSGDNGQHVPQEIVETWEPVYKQEELKIGNYPIEFKQGYINVNNSTFDREELNFMMQLLSKNNTKLLIQDVEINKELLQKILDKLKND